MSRADEIGAKAELTMELADVMAYADALEEEGRTEEREKLTPFLVMRQNVEEQRQNYIRGLRNAEPYWAAAVEKQQEEERRVQLAAAEKRPG